MYRIVISDGYETTIIRDNGDVIGVAATKNSAISIMLELNQIRGNFRSERKDGCNLNETCEGCQLQPGFVCENVNQSERDKVLEALKKDLQTRIISSSNQWSKGRNSGLLECCNIIDELRQAGEP